MGWWDGARTFAPRVVYRCRYVRWSIGPPLSIPRRAEIVGLAVDASRQGAAGVRQLHALVDGNRRPLVVHAGPDQDGDGPVLPVPPAHLRIPRQGPGHPGPARQHGPRTRRTAPAAPAPCRAPAGSGQSSPNPAKPPHTPLLVRRRVRRRERRVPGRVAGRRPPQAQPARADPARPARRSAPGAAFGPSRRRALRLATPVVVVRATVAVSWHTSGGPARSRRGAVVRRPRCGAPPHRLRTGYERAAAESDAPPGPTAGGVPSRRMSDVFAMLCRWSH